jgi:hypothetical protein
MITFLALYRGPSVERARLVATTVDPELVQEFARRLLARTEPAEQDGVAGRQAPGATDRGR